MKKVGVLTLATLALALADVKQANAGVVVGATINVPVASGYYSPAYSGYYSDAYAYPRPAYGYGYNGYGYCPPPRVVYSPPVVTYRPPVYAPVVSFGYNFGGGYYRHGHYPYHYRHYRGCW